MVQGRTFERLSSAKTATFLAYFCLSMANHAVLNNGAMKGIERILAWRRNCNQSKQKIAIDSGYRWAYAPDN